jgi:hypothetical protein
MITRPSGTDFIKCFHFIFNRFKPDCYFYGLIYCSRNSCISLIPVAFADEIAAQLMLMGLLVAGTSLVQCWIMPWRSVMPNFMDSITTLGGCFFFYVVLLGGAIAFILLVSYSVYFVTVPPMPYGIFLSHHKQGAAVLARWWKLLLGTMATDVVFLDSDNLRQLDHLFEMCAFQCKNIVVLLTREILSRLWCAGEVAVGVRNKVNMVLVTSEDYTPPDDEFLKGLETKWSDSEKSQVAALGIIIEAIEVAYRQLPKLPTITLDRNMALEAQSRVAQQAFELYKRSRKTTSSFMVSKGNIVIITDIIINVQRYLH